MWASIGSNSECRNETWAHIYGLFSLGPGFSEPQAALQQERRLRGRQRIAAAPTGICTPEQGRVLKLLLSLAQGQSVSVNQTPLPTLQVARNTGPLPTGHGFPGVGSLALLSHRDMASLM